MKRGKKIGLALSGGGYRAAVYHVGTLRALHSLGILDAVDIISSVSGGSITAAFYALHKDNYKDFETKILEKMSHGVLNSAIFWLVCLLFGIILISILIGYITYNITDNSGIGVFVGFTAFIAQIVAALNYSFRCFPASKFIITQYDKVFFNKATLSDLPDSPMLTINSTNVSTQLPFSFSKGYMGEYAYMVNGQSIFKPDEFPISQAVMASSCVPYGFTPITITPKYLKSAISQCRGGVEPPLLIDGGVYDNQGAHKLVQKKSKYHTDMIVVSDAGNSKVTARDTTNIIKLAMNTISIMMNRTKKMQRAENLYQDTMKNECFAYVPLEWDCGEKLLSGFVDNLRKGNVHNEVWQAHGISKDSIELLKSDNKADSQRAYDDILSHIKQQIGWNNLLKKAPTSESVGIARSVGTNLTALKKEQIDSLIAHSEWMTITQIRLYLPMLLEV